MKRLKIGLLQGNFRSAFSETIPEIACVAEPRGQMSAEDFRYNQQLLIVLAREAALAGADLVVGPESYVDGWSANFEILCTAATEIPGPITDEVCAAAAELRIWMCVGLFEKDQGKVFNSAVLISSEGEIVGTYRKTHETKSVLAGMPYALGNRLPVFETAWGKIGILICHDRWYPEAVRTLRCRGAELILNPVATAVFSPHHRYYEIHRCALRAQAYQNGIFWASCCGSNHGGHSLVISPDGRVVAEASSAQQTLIVEVDPRAHGSYDFISNLQAGLYRIP
jgi:deaminated glutathione amidase